MVIVKKKLMFSIGEVWFDEEPDKLSHIDVLYYWHRSQPIQDTQVQEVYTRLIDLTKNHDELWGSLSSNDRYKIRRAEQKDGIIYESWEDINTDTLNEFADFYDTFALQKGLTKLNRLQLNNLADVGLVDLSRIKLEDGTSLVWHAHYRNKNRSFLLHSASIKNKNDSSFQSLLGRANRYHHWQDILRFKKQGIPVYDFGGWYIGNTDEEKLRINEFKQKFGGEVVNNFNCSRGITMKGKLYLALQNIYRNIKSPA
ncbi:hypothetical protein Nos7524_0336 [Nostoc sp. PCC 7524]|uniref:hypothetical protein n=1 Tax=Nostoc sp. (strain ATCC 29411 / PCC 7524) TaxID=28072 RepID=UPI00029F1900|nr:hypothetical protein [Nostoc sp. PCC 7524]AFY46255.1 hypothetical protein Nos7524_0336 [Nostoc sp. PCC 7524]